MQSIDDNDYYDKRRQEELDDPEGTFWRRSELEGYQHYMDDDFVENKQEIDKNDEKNENVEDFKEHLKT
eukprot:3298628-Amphidinium_carterae.1